MLKAPPLVVSKDETELGINNFYHALSIRKINRLGTDCVPGLASARKCLVHAIRFYSVCKVVRNVLFRIRHSGTCAEATWRRSGSGCRSGTGSALSERCITCSREIQTVRSLASPRWRS